ncbi:KilA-N domain-containing protein [Xanthobacter autotrophicus]|uniref:KilA-N domain-containing protein n=1 Tax=Xanthobacter autotrophicus TaxID=280 RepID=UPI003728F9A3
MTTHHIAVPALVFNGVEIHARNEMLCLTDMWKAQGSDPARQAANWLASAEARNFIEALNDLNPGNSGVMAKKGKNGGTYAHWQIGLAYAKYLSPEFHMWCNTVVRERMEGKPQHNVLVLDEAAKGIIGNIVKNCAGLVIREQLAEMAPAIVSQFLPTAVAGYIADHNLALADGLTAGEVCDLAKVATSYPRGVSGRVSARLTKFCQRNGERPRISRLGRVRAQLFPTHLVRDWLDVEGRALIRRWIDEKKGQGALKLVPKA